MPVDEQTRAYITTQLQSQYTPTQIIESLVAGGWSAQQATMAVQAVSGVQLAAPTGPGGYSKPPILLRIAYWLSFLLLFAGMALLYSGFTLLFAADSLEVDLVLGDGFTTLFGIIFVVVGFIYLSSFIIMRKIKNGSWNALRLVTLLTIISFLGSFFLYYQTSEDPATAIGGALGQHLFPILFIIYAGKRHRAYFR